MEGLGVSCTDMDYIKGASCTCRGYDNKIVFHYSLSLSLSLSLSPCLLLKEVQIPSKRSTIIP